MNIKDKLPFGEEFVSSIEHRDKLLLLSTKGLYEVTELTLKPVPFEVKETKAKLAPDGMFSPSKEVDDIKITCPRCNRVHNRGGSCPKDTLSGEARKKWEAPDAARVRRPEVSGGLVWCDKCKYMKLVGHLCVGSSDES